MRFFLLLFLLIRSATVFSTIYYVDSKAGNNSWTGTSPNNAWSSIDKVNETIFKPGDKILFKRGSQFKGQLELSLIGTVQNKIMVGAYGKGAKPIIHGYGEKKHTVLLYNSTYCTIQDLEITNTGHEREAHRVGIYVKSEDFGESHQITLQNLTIKDVNGSLVKKDGSGGGIYWENTGNNIKTRFVGLNIYDCHIINCGRNGIYSGGYSGRDNWFPSLGVHIKGNLIEGVPGDGIVPIGCDGAIIENNIMRDCPDILSHDEAAAGIWPWSCDNTIIQYNEVSGHNAKWDGQGFDSDYNCNNTIIQYNYSYNNAGGFLLVCNDGSSLGKNWNKGTDNTIIRHNISINDGIRKYPTKQAGWFSPTIHITGPVTNSQFYGNLIIVDKKEDSKIDRNIVKIEDWGKKWPTNTFFFNNIFYVKDGEYGDLDLGDGTYTFFRDNTYIGRVDNIKEESKATRIKTSDIEYILATTKHKDRISRLKSLTPLKKKDSFIPGAIWEDNNGEHINAHGGGILFHEGKYYWFGEHKSANSNSALVGVTCYSSTDLYNWKNEGIALPVQNDDSPIARGAIIERPKVIYNERTKKFVMFFHLELKGKGYSAAHVGIATSKKVSGPYTFLKSGRVNAGFWPINMPVEQRNMKITEADTEEAWTPQWRKAVEEGLFVRRDFAEGQMSRDMTLFVDDDGIAYHIYSSEENLTLHLAELTDNYIDYTGKYIRIEPGGHNEAPSIFKHKGRYYMITSGCTGWEPNAARLLTADNIWGPWQLHRNPCEGDDAELTFHSQSTFILPVHGKEDTYIFMADRWTPLNPINGRYIWLPIHFENNMPVLRWKAEWKLDNHNQK